MPFHLAFASLTSLLLLMQATFHEQKDVLLLDLRRELFEQYIQSATEPRVATANSNWGGSSQKRSEKLEMSPSETLFSDRRYTSVGAILFLCFLVVSLVSVSAQKQHGTYFRLTVLELRGNQPIAQHSIADFGLIQKHCTTNLTGSVTSGVSITKTTGGGPASFEGWWFRTAADAEDSRQPARFKLEASDDAINWRVEGGSTWIASDWGEYKFGTGRFESGAPGEVVKMEHYVGWPW
eukprot:316071-Rhodomonas_salina.2